MLLRLAAVGAVALADRAGSGAGVLAAGVALLRRRCSLVATGAVALTGSADAAAERRRDGGRVAGGVGVCVVFGGAAGAAGAGAGVAAGGRDGAAEAAERFDPVGDGSGDDFFEALEGPVAAEGAVVGG